MGRNRPTRRLSKKLRRKVKTGCKEIHIHVLVDECNKLGEDKEIAENINKLKKLF